MGDCKGYPYDLPPMIDCGDINAERKLFAEASCAIERAKELNAKTNQILHHIKHFGLENGVWYSPKSVRTETAQAENLSKYTITTIKNRDECGDPIFLKIHTAYNNTIDNGLKEDIEQAAINECAQIITPAGTGNNFNGYTIVNGEIYPANVDDEGYTVGFNFKNIMYIYKNSDLVNDIERLKRDRIMQSFGCGVPCMLNGELVEESATDDETAPRTIIAQDSEYNTYILTTTDGLTITDSVSILKKLGCVKAVELAKGLNNSVVVDRGTPTIEGANITTPQVAYFYVSKKDFFKNRFQWDICRATITASASVATSAANLSEIKALTEKHNADIAEVIQKINDEVTRAETAENAIREALVDVEESLQTQINNITTDIYNANEIINSIKSDITAIKEKDTEQDEKLTELYSTVEEIQQMLSVFETAFNEFKENVNSTLTSHTESIEQNKNDIVALKSKDDLHSEQITNLQNEQTNIRELYTNQQAQLTSLDSALKTTLETISEIETTVNDLKELYANLVNLPDRMATIEESMATIEGSMQELKDMYANVANLPDRMATIEESMQEISEQLPLLEQKVTSQSQLIEQNANSITELNGKVNTIITQGMPAITNKVSELNDKVLGCETRIATLENDNTTNKSNISSNSGRITALENDNTTNKSNISSNSDRITALENDNETNKTTIADLVSKVGTNTADINNLKTSKADAESVTALETKVNENSENIGTLETSVADNSSAISSAKSDITNLQNNKADKTAVTELETQVDKNTSDIAELASRKIKIFSAEPDYFEYDTSGNTLNLSYSMRPANIFEGLNGTGIINITFDFVISKGDGTATLTGQCIIYDTAPSGARGIILGSNNELYAYRLGFSTGGGGSTTINIAVTPVGSGEALTIAGQEGSDLRCCIIE